jgi:hypothetical protein
MVTVSLDSPSCEVNLFDPVSAVYQDATRQTKGLYHLKYVGALWSGLAYLSRYNSSWFCHTFFLGFQIKQLKEGTFICQTKYSKDMLKKFDMENAKPIKTPMIGSLLYLCASRPDIMLRVCMCARFQANPKECHLVAIKRILRYLVYTPYLGLWYPKGSTFNLLGYSDSDYAGCKVDRKSTSGTCQFLGRSLVSWSSKK